MSVSSLPVYIGTYTKGSTSRGIYRVTLDTATGAIGAAEFVAEGLNPTFLAWSPDRRTLYSLAETGSVGGKPGGALTAYRVGAGGSLAAINTEPTGSISLAHVGLDATGRTAVAISYHGSQVASFPVAADGRLLPRTSLHTHTGQLGPRTDRQDKPHPHSVTFSPDNRHVYVCDLGLDKIFCYQLDAATATLMPAGETATAAGAGPRHAKFSGQGKFFHVINELNSTIDTYAADAASGKLTHLQAIRTLPTGFTGESICAEIRLGPDERFVYGSNRGHESLAVFARDAAKGTLSLVEIVPCGGKHPRNFALSPDGRCLICANKDSDNLVSYRVDPATGRLTPSGHVAACPAPVCVLF